MRFQLWSIFSSLLVGLIGCAGTYEHTLNFDPSEPLRVAVLPFVSIDEKGNIKDEEGRLVVDNLSLVSKKPDETPAQMVRRLALGQLEKSNFEIVQPALIDVDLPHHGFAKDDGKIDLAKLYATSPKEICTHFLTCDAVLYGKVTRWDRTYYGVESVNAVGLNFSLVSAKDGRTLFSAQGEDASRRGITKIPTGISSLVLAPIQGLDSKIIADLARDETAKLLAPLKVESQSAYLESSPPSVFAVSHDINGGLLSRTRPMTVLLFGTENQIASFSIGKKIMGVPMIERSPGHYYGEYLPLPGDSFSSQTVTASLTDKFGRTTSAEISKDPISLAPF